MNAQLLASACEVLSEEVLVATSQSAACQIALHLLAETRSRLQIQGKVPEFQPIAIYLTFINKPSVTPEQASRWVRRTGVKVWWNARQSSFDQELDRRGLPVRVELDIVVGGGAGNTTKYRLQFRDVGGGVAAGESGVISDVVAPSLDTVASPEADLRRSSRGSPEGIQIPDASQLSRAKPAVLVEYKRHPVRASWPLRWMFGMGDIGSQTLRGGVLQFLVVSMAMTWLLPTFWIVGGVIDRADISHVGLIGALILILAWAAICWPSIQPWLRVSADRVVIAPITYLAMREHFGQIEFVRDRQSSWMRGTFRLARYSAVCPNCAGMIDLTSGRRDFPGRIVGRCADSPMEHVYSFDPVSLTGSPLR